MLKNTHGPVITASFPFVPTLPHRGVAPFHSRYQIYFSIIFQSATWSCELFGKKTDGICVNRPCNRTQDRKGSTKLSRQSPTTRESSLLEWVLRLNTGYRKNDRIPRRLRSIPHCNRNSNCGLRPGRLYKIGNRRIYAKQSAAFSGAIDRAARKSGGNRKQSVKGRFSVPESANAEPW